MTWIVCGGVTAGPAAGTESAAGRGATTCAWRCCVECGAAANEATPTTTGKISRVTEGAWSGGRCFEM